MASTLFDGWTVWEFPGKPVRVGLSPGVVGRLAMAVQQGSQELPGRGLETGGLLIGSRTETDNPVTVQVYDFEPVKSEHAAGPSYLLSDRDRHLLASRIAAHEATCKNSSIVGVYRSHTRPDFAITEEDAALFSTYFKNASDVFLLIRPNDHGAPTGGFIIREGGQVVSNSPYVQFPLRGTVVPQAVREIPLPSSREPQERPQPAVRILPFPAMRRAADRATFWLPAVGVMILAVGLYWGIPSRTPGSTPVKPPALSVAFIGDSLRLSWDRQISKRADHAVLWIKDGAETKQLDLDSKQLSEGGVVYRPKHSDVEFRLETLSPGAHATESVRAIGVPSQAAIVRPAPEPVALESPTVSPAFSKTPRRTRIVQTVAAPNRPRPHAIGTASRQASSAFELPPVKHTSATVSLPDPPTIRPAVMPPPSSGNEVLKLVASTNRMDAADLPVRVSVEPVPALRRSFPILKRTLRSDYVPPAVLRNPGLHNPPRRNVARNVNIDVKVYVNPAGKVDYSEVLSNVAESDRDLAALAVFSARRWEFVPARTKDGAVAGEMILHYQFGPGARESGSGNLAGR